MKYNMLIVTFVVTKYKDSHYGIKWTLFFAWSFLPIL